MENKKKKVDSKTKFAIANIFTCDVDAVLTISSFSYLYV